MTREEEMIRESQKRYDDVAFIDGVKWADEHPINPWHDAMEEPQEYPILCKDKLGNIWVEYSLYNYVEGWAECVEFNDIIQWAYIRDLLPKGGEK